MRSYWFPPTTGQWATLFVCASKFPCRVKVGHLGQAGAAAGRFPLDVPEFVLYWQHILFVWLHCLSQSFVSVTYNLIRADKLPLDNGQNCGNVFSSALIRPVVSVQWNYTLCLFDRFRNFLINQDLLLFRWLRWLVTDLLPFLFFFSLPPLPSSMWRSAPYSSSSSPSPPSAWRRMRPSTPSSTRRRTSPLAT